MRPEDLLALDGMFETWAAAGQIVPTTDGWRVWLMMAGRGFGKTRAGAEWVNRLAMSGKRRIALVGGSMDEARAIMIEGPSGLLRVAGRHRLKVKWEPSLRRLTWPQGSVAELFSGDHADGLRGPEHDFAWCARADRPAGRGRGRSGADRGAPGDPGDRDDLSGRGERATGAFAGMEARLAGWTAGGWRFVAPVEGIRLTLRSSGVDFHYWNGAWRSGSVRAEELLIGGVRVVGSAAAAIADPAGGTGVDANARICVGQILAALRGHGLIQT